ncbi:hypothetical protein [Mycolicibacterium phlei]
MDAKKLSLVGAGLWAGALMAAPGAAAQPVDPAPAPPPPPAPIVAVAAPAPEAPAAPAEAPLPTPPDGIPHLASPEAPPPGTTADPNAVPREDPNISYLKDLWYAVQNHEISAKEALIMGLAQRGMNTPIPQQAPGPNVPSAPADPAAAPPPPPPAPEPAPAP